MTYVYPPPVHPGDTIGIMAPSSFVEPDTLAPGIAALEQRGYRVHLHPQTFLRDRQSAGTAADKCAALYDLWNDPAIGAVLAAGGGNRSLHMLEALDTGRLKATPKAFVGFSDSTVLLNAFTAHLRIVTFHGPVLGRVRDNPDLDSLVSALGGRPQEPDLRTARVVRSGQAQGVLIGGTLSLVQYLAATPDLPDPEGAILFLEDVSEEFSHIDRMLLHLRRAGVLKVLSGLILGTWESLQDRGRPYGFTLEDIVAEHTRDTHYPIVMGAPFGHGAVLPTFPIGGKARLSACEKDGIYLKFYRD